MTDTPMDREKLSITQKVAMDSGYWPITAPYDFDKGEKELFEKAWLQVADKDVMAVKLPDNRVEIWRNTLELKGKLA